MESTPTWLFDLISWFAEGDPMLDDELVPLTLGEYHHVQSEDDLNRRFSQRGDTLYVVAKPMTVFPITYDCIQEDVEDTLIRCSGPGMQGPIYARRGHLQILTNNGLLHYKAS